MSCADAAAAFTTTAPSSANSFYCAWRLNRGFVTVVLPDRDVPFGVIPPGEEILIYREGSTYGATLRRPVSVVEPPASKPTTDWQPSIASGNRK
jgi:hypothetical protein